MTAKLSLVASNDSSPQLPPYDDAAERAVLSGAMLDPLGLPRVEDLLRAEMFFSEAHGRIYEAAVAVREAGRSVDLTTVHAQLGATSRLSQIGGAGYLAEIADASPSLVNIRSHAEVVHERWRARMAIRAAQRIAAEGYAGADDVQRMLDDGARVLLDLARKAPGRRVESNIDTLKRLVREMGNPASGNRKRGIPTGIRSYDEATLGLHAGQKTTVVALPRVGKTAFGLQVAMNVARLGIGVVFFSTELTRDELAERQLSYLSGVDYGRLRKARQEALLTPREWGLLSQGLGSLQNTKYRLTVYDDPAITVEEIAARVSTDADRFLTEHGVPLGLVVVDYVQRLRPSPQFERGDRPKKHEYVAHATCGLKQLAQRLMIPVIELAQQKNIKSERRAPALGDAADCMQIEREADNVVYLHRPNDKDGTRVQALLVKQRAGLEAELDLSFDGGQSRFEEPR
jgi:replicative DNA helicase